MAKCTLKTITKVLYSLSLLLSLSLFLPFMFLFVYAILLQTDKELLPEVESNVQLREFFRALALCHTVVPENTYEILFYIILFLIC